MLRIYLKTGTAFLKFIEVEGSIQDDLVQLIDDYYLEHRSLPVPMYTFSDLLEMFSYEDYSVDDNGLSIALDNMLPINGGEYYIDGVSHLEVF